MKTLLPRYRESPESAMENFALGGTARPAVAAISGNVFGVVDGIDDALFGYTVDRREQIVDHIFELALGLDHSFHAHDLFGLLHALHQHDGVALGHVIELQAFRS